MKEIQLSTERSIERIKHFLSLLSSDLQENFNLIQFSFLEDQIFLKHFNNYYEAFLLLHSKDYLTDHTVNRSVFVKLSLLKEILMSFKTPSLIFKEESLEIRDEKFPSDRFLLPLTRGHKEESRLKLNEITSDISFSSQKFKESWNLLSGLSENDDRGINFIISQGKIEAVGYSLKKAGYLSWKEPSAREDKRFVLTKKQFMLTSKLFRLSQEIQLVFSEDINLLGSDFNFKFYRAVSNAMTQQQVLSLFKEINGLSFSIEAENFQTLLTKVTLVASRPNDRARFEIIDKQLFITTYSPINGKVELSTMIQRNDVSLEEGGVFEVVLEILLNLLRRLSGLLTVTFNKVKGLCLLESKEVKYLFLY